MLSTPETTEATGPEKGYVVLQDGETIPIVNTTSTCTPTVSDIGTLPVVKGFLEGKSVTVLRDTGCNTVVVREALVPKGSFTGTKRPVFLLDRTVHHLPEAIVSIDTPFFTGTVRAKCMQNPLYDVVLGNIKGVLPAEEGPEHKPQQQNEASHADRRATNTDDLPTASRRTGEAGHRFPETGAKNTQVPKDSSLPLFQTEDQEGLPSERAAVAQGTPRRATSSLPVLKTAAGTIDKATLEEFQRNDAPLRRCYESVGKKMIINSREACYFLSDGILYRRHKLLSGKELEQLVVPVQLRETVLMLAHEGILAGHQGISRTTDRILAEFYWPGVQSETKRYVKSCDICQRTVPRHLVGRAPLGTMPVIETPFSRVGIDIVGPLSPTSYQGNRYILTMVDFATRYPDAIPLPSIESKMVAEGLMEMFSRVGLPREIVSDRGTNFMSSVMKEFSRLLSVKQLPTTPYHPMANGLVERFNGTLKRMLGRMCQECPKNWDRYLGPLLFAYREMPQRSTGYSPFELLYGRYVRGPMTILKDLWTNPKLDEVTKSAYEYIVELRQRLERTCDIAAQELSKAHTSQKRYYDRKAKKRELAVGDKVLVLLPADSNKLILTWKGPFKVVQKKSPLDYAIDLGHRTTVFHINMLKKYEERTTNDPPPPTVAAVSSLDQTELEDSDSSLHTPLIQTQTWQDVTICPQLTTEQRNQVTVLLATYHDIFSDLPGKTNVLECQLKLTTDIPIHVRQYPMPFAVKEAVETEVMEMLRLGIIEKSTSAYQAPIVVVKKKDGTMRLCIDFRQLNNVVVPDAEPIPRPDMMFAQLTGRQYFSKFDFTKGYWQVPMASTSKAFTAFSCDSGLYQFRFMPFGIKTAPAVFNRLMREVVGGIPNVYYYFDDVLVATTTWEEHIAALRNVFQRVREAHLTIKPKKSEIGSPTTSFLGHVVGQGLLQHQKDTSDKIVSAKRPENKKELRAFLGLTGYYREFVPNYAEISHPLTELTKKGSPNKLDWRDKHQDAFQKLKETMSSQPILNAPNLERPFVLRTDASSRSLGAVLLQEYNGHLHPVSYASRKLLPREAAYSTIERECLAIVWGVQKFHVYLYGRPFILQSDHQPLKYINSARQVNTRVLRWSLLLMDYDFRVEYIRGSDNVGADYLSRTSLTPE
ncbi:uncharacterized protein LOC119403222 [Rhipicephalus sanguineus]|uniref:uncharacterized protein LOC119403222 n=1 Tax=Rhipicephalus sanguineus TaxID=34632 RepID=UPI001893DF65|nr:uncharacterized protein LOC119403222 [Rhipicephalus sanguineus]